MDEKTKGIMIRSRARWIQHGERSPKYFTELEKRNYLFIYLFQYIYTGEQIQQGCLSIRSCTRKPITKLITKESYEITNPDKVLEMQKQFYKTIFTRSCKQDQAMNETFFADEGGP